MLEGGEQEGQHQSAGVGRVIGGTRSGPSDDEQNLERN
jgi:hypothetical protein